MRIFGCSTIDEYRNRQLEKINKWIDDTFFSGCVEWYWNSPNSIKVVDTTGDSMIVLLDEIE